jgi:hypothetical protein
LKESYIRINLILAGIIACIMLYSGIFSAEKENHPIPCLYTKLTGVTCPGCGLSRSFSAMIRGEFVKAKIYNSNGPKIFIFFAIELILRIVINLSLLKKTRLPSYIWISDSAIAIILFIYCFNGLIFWRT